MARSDWGCLLASVPGADVIGCLVYKDKAGRNESRTAATPQEVKMQEIFKGLNLDILLEILGHLCAEDVLRFRSVCASFFL